jgi:hypothetical protein
MADDGFAGTEWRTIDNRSTGSSNFLLASASDTMACRARSLAAALAGRRHCHGPESTGDRPIFAIRSD